MKILALEFSSAQRSVAVCAGISGAQRSARPTALVNQEAASLPPRALVTAVDASGAVRGHAAAAGGRSTRAFALIQAALQQAQCEREDIECIAVGLGPGSYTGIRVAIAIAQGWQLARAVKLLGLSSVECLAAQLQAEGRAGRYTVAIDAQRNEFYLATGEVSPAGWHEIEPLRLAPLAEVQRRADTGERVVGPELTQWFPSARNLFPDAAALGRLAAARSDFVAGEQLAPIYLRPTAFVKAPPPRFP
jgi:tRNA threonylcarbamoyl adenosine modification protein YeaZ